MRNFCFTKFKKFIDLTHLEWGNTCPIRGSSDISYIVIGNEVCPETGKKH